MLEGFVGGLIVAFILSWFGINNMIIEVVQPFIESIVLTDAHYYLLFGLIGLIGGAFAHR